MKKSLFVSISLRGTERNPSSGGALDSVGIVAKDWNKFFNQLSWMKFEDAGFSRSDLTDFRLTQRFCSILNGVFSQAGFFCDSGLSSPIFRVSLDDVVGEFYLKDAIAFYSAASDGGASEGDDVCIVLLLEEIVGEDCFFVADCDFVDLNSRLTTPKDVVVFLNKAGLLSDVNCCDGWKAQPAFYIVPVSKGEEGGGDVNSLIQDQKGGRISALVVAYLLYCWLLCLRCESLAISIELNGDWDSGTRQLILARKRLALAWKYARLKNRAAVNSPMLKLFLLVSDRFRLFEQVDNLSELLDQLSKAIELQSAYILARRVRIIETILFVATVSGLGVGINAIQMPPFYDPATTNALARSEFWAVFFVVALGVVALSLGVTLWQRFGLRKKFFFIFKR